MPIKSFVLILLCVHRCFADDLVQSNALGELFDKGEYRQAIEASRIAYEEGEKEVGLYVAAASSSLVGEYRNAVRFCRQYLSENPDGKYQIEIAYYYGVSLARMGYKEMAESLLEQLVGAAEGRYKYLSLYELGMLELRAGDYGAAQAYAEQLLGNKLDAEQQVQAQLLLGQSFEARGNRDLAEKSYLSAYQLAVSGGLVSGQEESLFYLIAFYGREKIMGEANPNMAKALPHYEAFEKSFPDSEYRAQVLVAILPALNEAGRSREVIEKLDAAVRKALMAGGESGVQDAARALLWERMNQGEEISKIREGVLAESSEEDGLYKALMRSALADIYEIGAEQAHLSWGRQMKFRALARGLRCALVVSPESRVFPGFVQLQLGELLLESEGAANEAKQYFQRASRSQVEVKKLWAKLGVAQSLAQQGGESLKEALSILGDLEMRVEGDSSLLERVLLTQLHLLDELAQWQELQQKAEFYFSQAQLKGHRDEVLYFLAKSYDQQGLVEDAIANYTQIFTASTGNLPISAPAVERLTQLTWDRNKPGGGDQLSDRQIAYQLAQRYLSLVKDTPKWRQELPEVHSHLVQIRESVALWEQSGAVQTVDEILEEMRKGDRPIIRK